MSGVVGLIVGIAFVALAVAQLVAGFVGIEHEVGTWWAWGAVAVALLMRFTLPLTVGAFFGAMYVWHWHWLAALLFAAPGLLLMLPSVVGLVTSQIRK